MTTGWTVDTSPDEPHIHIEGTRATGDTIDMQVGATSEVFNTYGYGDKATFNIGTD